MVGGLEAAWACFEGVPRYLVIDNFPAAVAGADALHPRFTRGFLEYARQRGFITDPARVRRPRDSRLAARSQDPQGIGARGQNTAGIRTAVLYNSRTTRTAAASP